MSNENELALRSQMADAFQGTVPTGSMSALTSYSQAKGAYFTGPDGEKAAAVFGIFLFSVRPTRSWWAEQGGGAPPDCWSLDGLRPDDLIAPSKKQNATCRGCPQDELGTARVGKGKACRAKAIDFFLEFADVGAAKEIGDFLPVDIAKLMGPAMVRYSIANREAEGGLASAAREAKRLGFYPQQLVWEWGFKTGKSKNGTDFDYVSLTPLGRCPEELMPQILQVVTELKGGAAVATLRAMASSGSALSE